MQVNLIHGDKPLNSQSQPQHIDTTQCTQKLHICANTLAQTCLLKFTHNAAREQRKLERLREGKGNSEWRYDLEQKKQTYTILRELKGNNKREDANTALMKVCLNVCLLPAWGSETLGNPSGRWPVKNSTTSSCCCLPTILFYSLSFQDLTALRPCIFHHSPITCQWTWAKKWRSAFKMPLFKASTQKRKRQKTGSAAHI